MSILDRRRLLTALASLAAAPAARAQAAPWPARPIRMVIPFPPGGPTDIVARVLAERMSRSLGQPIVIENRPGANGNIGNDVVAKAEPDGYTVLYNTSSIALSPAIYTKLSYDAQRDLAPVVQTATIPMVLAVNPSVPVQDVKGFVEYLRARPNALSFGSSGTGNVTHLTATMLLRSQGIEAVHVPYRGSAPALVDAIAGQVQFVTDTVNSALPLIRDGKLRALAVTSPKRLGPMPDVPTIAETIIPGFDAGAWQGIMVPARTPRPVIDRLNAVAMEALADPAVLAKLAEQGTEPLGSTPEEYGRILRAETERWGRVIAENGVKLD
ncbi:Bug family tripartite tricarboxylate transporter substrate binding protein [Roseomonas xinghualingensis]|uniref:Bug family tripartite tricarboxylate transporter substrate binding protein n=1 Tax=Roseomonas xinghualingensis TaxID=2986475 RepID=UPI0021F1D8E2|nr:tripartite tricarboxylate transporter substrate binding protein [Roseomonas sp. SXEYE001]MCV4207203.1 tripartite tricarboxylate transporter substrate binding protein [Roseomonas sp. SXEYE001]